MDIDFLPEHLLILGGSYVGLEFAQVYRRFGSKMTVIEHGPRLLAREDQDVSRAIAGFLKEEGIDVRVNSAIVGVEKPFAPRSTMKPRITPSSFAQITAMSAIGALDIQVLVPVRR